MVELSDTSVVPVIRIDFDDPAAWAVLQAELLAPCGDGSGYEAKLEFVDWRDWSGRDAQDVDAVVPRGYPTTCEYPFMIVVDARAISGPEHPVFLIDVYEEDTAESFRAVAREVAGIEANLTLGNMAFSEFGDNVDDDGVFRGFQ